MKISKQKLKEIIKEELSSLKETLWDDRYDDVERMRPRRQPRNPEHVKQDEERREKDREHKAWLQRRKDRGLDEAEETALNSPGEAGRQWEAAKMNLTAAATAALGDGLSPRDIRNATTAVTTALEDGLSPRDIRNAIEEILSSAPDEGPRFTSTGPWAPEYRDK